MNLPKQIWEGEDRLIQWISTQIWLKNKRHRKMIAIATPKLIPIPGSLRVASVFTLGFNHVGCFVND
jgi:hypothetical protein